MIEEKIHVAVDAKHSLRFDSDRISSRRIYTEAMTSFPQVISVGRISD
jgi:hypothetical protein